MWSIIVQARDFPSRRLRKRAPDDDQVAFRDKCNELRLRAEEQEALHPVSFAIGNSWNETLRSDKQHYLEYTTRSMTQRFPLFAFLPLPACACTCLTPFFGCVLCPGLLLPWVPVDPLPSPALLPRGSVLHAPFCFPPPDWYPLVAVLSLFLGCFLVGFCWSASVCVCLRCRSLFACLLAFALHVSPLCFLLSSPSAFWFSVVWLWLVWSPPSLPPRLFSCGALVQ